ncbi:hypothetical protein AERO_09970 [Aeromicrobium fastidiosum]|uniref:hypothetical protein n=1 Tax=Aeromicrobium fastidiosum TaxID=52699 RepID=UPI00202324DB|nr:hypothetical protein [Aeromicrobium fastidiosum]MCL8251709.1 hypothetical protein [Aeromicrobium fastidiosum]
MDWLWVLLVAVRVLSPSPDDQWAVRLAALDDVREQAFASADASLLRDVYVEASAARRPDARLIAAYARRGGRVVGAELRVLDCRVVREGRHRVRLEVVDQLGPARVRWDDGTSTALPRDRPTRRAVTLVRSPGQDAQWRIAGTRPAQDAG